MCTTVYILYNDYYQIINTVEQVAQLRQHKQRLKLNDLRTQLGGWNSYYHY